MFLSCIFDCFFGTFLATRSFYITRLFFDSQWFHFDSVWPYPNRFFLCYDNCGNVCLYYCDYCFVNSRTAIQCVAFGPDYGPEKVNLGSIKYLLINKCGTRKYRRTHSSKSQKKRVGHKEWKPASVYWFFLCLVCRLMNNREVHMNGTRCNHSIDELWRCAHQFSNKMKVLMCCFFFSIIQIFKWPNKTRRYKTKQNKK